MVWLPEARREEARRETCSSKGQSFEEPRGISLSDLLPIMETIITMLCMSQKLLLKERKASQVFYLFFLSEVVPHSPTKAEGEWGFSVLWQGPVGCNRQVC
jgi:hypothetical protein